ncbi:hypothetical protein [Floridanema evergladense]|uniref:Uncharacterized protein n=1 Tax=Floridaenema evergladense BLCC-F167 TaxID=3153639 RepID=A0ABV4WR83_9CYAN
MKAYEFTPKVTNEGKLNCTEEILKQLPPNQELKVIVLVNELTKLEEDEAAERDDWHDLAAEQFFADYNEEDAIYDDV